jgi:uncharacterized membrane protein YidH (DUF202 family)
MHPRFNRLKEVSIVSSIVLTFFTFGIYFIWWQKKQMLQIGLLANEETESVLKWLFLSLITFGLYHVYCEYQHSHKIMQLQEKYNSKQLPEYFPYICLGLSLFGMFLVTDIVHQDELNKIVKKAKLANV